MEPDPTGDDLIAVGRTLSEMGINLSYDSVDTACRLEAARMLRDYGARTILASEPLTEAVLPDNTPRDDLLDTLRYQLNRCQASRSLLVVDPYLFPTAPDPKYQADLVSLLSPAAKAGLLIQVATKANGNASLQTSVVADLRAINSTVMPTFKYTNVFHDRYWIADGERGLFVGTSLNGIGRRYAVADYLMEEDARSIASRYAQLP